MIIKKITVILLIVQSYPKNYKARGIPLVAAIHEILSLLIVQSLNYEL